MPRILHMFHGDQLHKVPDMQTIRRRIESDIKENALLAEQFVQFLFVDCLLNKSPRTQYVHYVFLFHKYLLFTVR